MKHKLLAILACLAALVGCEKKPLTQRQILELIYKDCGGAAWDENARTNWCTDAPLNEWAGVTADQEDNVTALRIRECVGVIPAEIAGLTGLTELNLAVDNSDLETPPENPVPQAIEELAGLERLYLIISGSPVSVLPDLTKLTALKSVYLSLPDDVPYPPVPAQLESLDIDGGCGPIPESYYDLTALERISITTSNLGGPISPKVGQMTALKHLQVDQTAGFIGNVDAAEGELPQEIFSLTGLENIFLRRVSTGGSLPAAIGDMQNLRGLTIISCGLTGGIPAEVGKLSKLSRMSIYNNPEIGGVIPPEIGDMAALRDLSLANDGLTGTIPATLGKLSKLEGIQLQKNQLTGKIPAELADCTNLGNGVFIDFSGNQLDPDIPAAVKAMPKFDKFKF